MTNSNSDRPHEFELIAKLFAPLAAGVPGAFGLTDDAATISLAADEELVVTADLLTAGVHFRADDPPDRIAQKALRVNLSDLAAKGAVPRSYLLSLALPCDWQLPWMEAFAKGLAADQKEFSVSLIGGDTTATDGPFTIAITAMGSLPSGTMILRSGAKPGDLVFVSGTIGDAGAGLAALNGSLPGAADVERHILEHRYQTPSPRVTLGAALRGIATAALDVSDGLLADLGHIASTSNVRAVVEAECIPLSDAFRSVGGNASAAAVAGDDYEIAFTAPAGARQAIQQIARQTNTAVTQVGRIEAGQGVALLDSSGREIPVSRTGYRHF